MRLLLLVTHLQGVGHLSRMAAIGRAAARRGFDVTLISGGLPVATVDLTGLEVVQLAPARIEGNDFRRLLDESGTGVDGLWRAVRLAAILGTIDRTRPDVFVTELYPFGRRQLATEVDAALEQAHAASPRPAVFASIRDVLTAPSSPAKAEGVESRLARFYDRVLVHGDPAFLPLEASWPVTPALTEKLTYTGYVVEREEAVASPEGPGAGEILVSAGGSATGRPLFEAAIGAASLWPDGPPWRILIGGRLDAAERAAFFERSGAHVTIESARSDFPALLARCQASISRGGYNTVVETLTARARAVIVPFEDGRETEQRQRAEALAHLGLATMLPEADLSPESLLTAVKSALSLPAPAPAPLSFDGCDRTVTFLETFKPQRR